jgi:hypothetical protein
MTAAPVPGAAPVAFGTLDDLRRFNLDGEHFVSELNEDASANSTSQILPSGETLPRFSGPGQVVGLLRLR